MSSDLTTTDSNKCNCTNAMQASEGIGSGTTGYDPDVAGPGVVLGFILTGLLAFALSCMCLGLRAHLRNQHRVRSLNSSMQQPETACSSPLDQVLKFLAPSTISDPTTFWIATLERFLITLSDQQLITGMLLLVLSCIKYYDHDFLSLLAATDLVFFAALTHATTLQVLRVYLRRHPKMTAVRLVIAVSTLTLWAVVVIIILTRALSAPLLEKLLSSPYRVINILGIVTEITELVGLFLVYVNLSFGLWLSDTAIEARAALSSMRDRDLFQLQTWVDECNDRHDFFLAGRGYNGPKSYIEHQIVRFCTYYISVGPSWTRAGLWLIAEILFPWYTSMYMLGLLLALGLINLGLDLYQSGLSDSWGFGQLLPTFLILLPIFTFFETYGDEPRSHHHLYIASSPQQNNMAFRQPIPERRAGHEGECLSSSYGLLLSKIPHFRRKEEKTKGRLHGQ